MKHWTPQYNTLDFPTIKNDPFSFKICRATVKLLMKSCKYKFIEETNLKNAKYPTR